MDVRKEGLGTCVRWWVRLRAFVLSAYTEFQLRKLVKAGIYIWKKNAQSMAALRLLFGEAMLRVTLIGENIAKKQCNH
jgi:hypothetical protein